MNYRRPLVAIVFAASVVASIATSYAPAWHLQETVRGTALALSPEAPKVAFLVKIIGNRATFSATSPPAWRVSVKGLLHAGAAPGGAESVVLTSHEATTTSSGTTARIPAGADGSLDYDRYLDDTAPCTTEVCEQVMPLNFFLLRGGAVTGSFDVTVDIDGPDVPHSEAPQGATLKVNVELAP